MKAKKETQEFDMFKTIRKLGGFTKHNKYLASELKQLIVRLTKLEQIVNELQEIHETHWVKEE